MNIRKEHGATILELCSEDLDDARAVSQLLEEMFDEDGVRRVVVDLSAIDAIYSMQIGTLVTMHVLCYENLAVMKLAGASEKVKGLLRMVGLEAMMEVHHGVDVAAQSFRPETPADAPKSSKAGSISRHGHTVK